MERIGTVGRPAAIRAGTATPRRGTAERPYDAGEAGARTAGRALVVVDGGRRAEPGAASRRPDSGFVTQILLAAEPSLRPSRLERTRTAAACYAETARRLA